LRKRLNPSLGFGACGVKGRKLGFKSRERSIRDMDHQQQQQVNEAAEKFADAVRDSYRVVTDRAVSAQQLNAELTQNFFNSVINNLRAQAESNRAMTQELADQQERQREATQALTQESVGAYMDFINSMFSYYQGAVDQAQQEAGSRRPQGT
jgi:hypothetical protein